MNEARFAHYKTNIPEIDAEHWGILLHMDATRALCKSTPLDPDAIRQSLQELHNILVDHLVNEEELMDAVNYTWVAAHKHEHDRIRAKILTLLAAVGTRIDTRTTDYIINDLEHLLVGHIDAYDMQITL